MKVIRVIAVWCVLAGALFAAEVVAAPAAENDLTFACSAENDLFRSVTATGHVAARYESASEAVSKASDSSAVLILADGYPKATVRIADEVLAEAKRKRLKLFVEYPEAYPGLKFEPARVAEWERGVVASKAIDLGLPEMRIVALHSCHFLPATGGQEPLLVLGRVAGFDTALFGLPKERYPILFAADDGTLIATTKLSNFITGRYAPSAEWQTIWQSILDRLDPGGAPHRLQATPSVRPAFQEPDELPASAEKESLAGMAQWLRNSRLLVNAEREAEIRKMLLAGTYKLPAPQPDEPIGDGSLGIMEGYTSQIEWDGSQTRIAPLRADCNAESAAVLAMHAAIAGDEQSGKIASNLLDFVYFKSDLQQGIHADPKHPSYGLIGWGAIAPAWTVANYGDDNARTILATLAAAAVMKSDKWDESVARAIVANLRTTGKLGFRSDRVDNPALEQLGWKHYYDAETVNFSPHFEAYMWACYLYAYAQTGDAVFLDRTKMAIQMTMKAYPDQWRWGDPMERAHMLLTLAWLVRLEDTSEHRAWLNRIADDLLATQQPCGAFAERLREGGGGHYVVPDANEKYGTSETPLIQENGDPVSDQLYANPFILLGLHEAAAATGNAKLKESADKLAEYLVRIQVRSQRIPYLDGAWFRAFDYGRWDYWASSADLGWGAWSAEAGWGQTWAAIMLGLREKDMSLWDLLAEAKIGEQLTTAREQMLDE